MKWAMASARGDDDGEKRSHPLAEDRPGVYVQVVAPRRRKGRKTPEVEARASACEQNVEARSSAREPNQEARATHAAEVVAPQEPALGVILDSALDAQPKPESASPAPPPDLEPAREADSERPSGEREIVSERPGAYVRALSDNSNGRNDPVVVTLPPPPRLPSFLPPEPEMRLVLRRAEAEDAVAPTVLDAPVSLRRERAPAARRAPAWSLWAFVAALSAIVGSALVVAWRGAGAGSEASSEQEPPAELAPLSTPRLQQLDPATPSPARAQRTPTQAPPHALPAPPAAAHAPSPARAPSSGAVPSVSARLAGSSPGLQPPAPSARIAQPAASPVGAGPVAARAFSVPAAGASDEGTTATGAGTAPAASQSASEPIRAADVAAAEAAAPANESQALPDNPYAE
jgi:hypothetical protein